MRDIAACAACGVETDLVTAAQAAQAVSGQFPDVRGGAAEGTADGDGTAVPQLPVCPICADERQFVPAGGQEWTSRNLLEASGRAVSVAEAEPGLFSLRTSPKTGIGQTCYLAQCPAGGTGGLLFDVPPYIDDAAVEAVAARGGAAAIVASHPHMYGLQLEWSAAFDHAPVFVARRDAEWVQRRGAAIELFDEEIAPLAGVRVRQVGGHFPGSSVALWRSPADEALVMLGGDTISPVARTGWVTFMRSFPNYLPLSGAVVRRIAAAVDDVEVERIYGNFGQRLTSGGSRAIEESARRYAEWVSGEHDDLT
ncbi:hydrolase [Brevibacterium salitolerans]